MIAEGIKTTWMTIEGVHIRCFVAGDRGTPVILLHGGGIDSALLSWGRCIGPLAASHRVFAPDLPGYGKSDRPSIPYSMKYYIAFLEKMMDALQLERANLIGLSMGGGIALGLTLDRPSRVDKLVLVDTYGIQDRATAHKLSYLLIRIPYFNELAYWFLGRSRSMIRWSLLAGLIVDPRHLSDELIDAAYQAARRPGAGKAFTFMQRNDLLWNGLRTNFTRRLSEIAVQTLIVHGEKDSAVPVAYAQRAHKLIKNSRLIMLPGAGHWAQAEQPELFLQAVLPFLEA